MNKCLSFLKEFPIAEKEKQLLSQLTSTPATSQKPDKISIVGILIAYFFSMMIFILLETLAVPLMTDQYGWEDDFAVVVVSIVSLLSGFLGILVILSLRQALKKFDERSLILFVGFLPIALGTFIDMPLYTDIRIPMSNCTTYVINHTSPSNSLADNLLLSSASLENEAVGLVSSLPAPFQDTFYYENVTECTPGCPEEQTWCHHVSQIPLAQFLVANLLVILGFPTVTAISIALFSKAVGTRPQGVWMALLAEVLAVSRVAGPVVAAYLYANFGTIISFGTMTAAMVFAIISYILVRGRFPKVKKNHTDNSKPK